MSFNLEQSFWFVGVSFDKRDYPICEIKYTDTIDKCSSLFDDYNLLDYVYGNNRVIKLSELFKADNEEKWSTIREKVKKCESIIIFNDILTKNTEIGFIADFYLRVFYAAIKQVNSNCYVYDMRPITCILDIH